MLMVWSCPLWSLEVSWDYPSGHHASSLKKWSDIDRQVRAAEGKVTVLGKEGPSIGPVGGPREAGLEGLPHPGVGGLVRFVPPCLRVTPSSGMGIWVSFRLLGGSIGSWER